MPIVLAMKPKAIPKTIGKTMKANPRLTPERKLWNQPRWWWCIWGAWWSGNAGWLGISGRSARLGRPGLLCACAGRIWCPWLCFPCMTFMHLVLKNCRHFRQQPLTFLTTPSAVVLAECIEPLNLLRTRHRIVVHCASEPFEAGMVVMEWMIAWESEGVFLWYGNWYTINIPCLWFRLAWCWYHQRWSFGLRGPWLRW